jgi:hypothetical protein
VSAVSGAGGRRALSDVDAELAKFAVILGAPQRGLAAAILLTEL